MANDDRSGTSSLVGFNVSDVLGLGKAGAALVEAIRAGVGSWWTPRQVRRIGEAERANFRKWLVEIEQAGLHSKQVELSLSERAAIRLLGSDAPRYQSNREAISREAIESLRDEAASVEGLEPPATDPDWLDQFWRLAEQINDRDMQTVWGRILSRQTSGADRYSPRTLHALSVLTKDEATQLVRMASVTMDGLSDGSSAILNHFTFPKDKEGDAAREANKRLRDSLPSFDKRLFGSIGILIEDGFAHPVAVAGADPLTVRISGSVFSICGPSPSSVDHGNYQIGSGHELSPLGIELMRLIKIEPEGNYMAKLKKCVSLAGFELRPASK